MQKINLPIYIYSEIAYPQTLERVLKKLTFMFCYFPYNYPLLIQNYDCEDETKDKNIMNKPRTKNHNPKISTSRFC